MTGDERDSDYQTHVFTCTYTADVSGVCSAMYELGGMTVIHDPSGCNSTYSTHDEPRWYEGDSLMFVSGLDEMTAVLGDDSVLIRDISAAAADLHPRFITLCGGSIPHIIAFDFRGTAHLIEKKTGIPVLPVPTDGLKSYVSGVGMALTAWIRRFADPEESDWDRRQGQRPAELTVNLLGVTPLDFSVNGNVLALRKVFEDAGIAVNCTAAMGDSFETLQHIYRGTVNVVVSSAGRRPARFMEKIAGIPRVEGLPVGPQEAQALLADVRASFADGRSRCVWEEDGRAQTRPDEIGGAGVGGSGGSGRREAALSADTREADILVIGEEVFAQSLADAINRILAEAGSGRKAEALFPDIDEGLSERPLAEAIRRSHLVIADPLYRVLLPRDNSVRFIDFPHEAYSGRIYRKRIPVFATDQFDVAGLLK